MIKNDNETYVFSNGEYRTNGSNLYGSNYTVYGDGNIIHGDSITVIGNKTIGKNCKRCHIVGDDVNIEGALNHIRGERPTVRGRRNTIISRSPGNIKGFGNKISEPQPRQRETGMMLLAKITMEKMNLPEAIADEMDNEQIRRYAENHLGWEIGTFDHLVKDSERKKRVIHCPEPVEEEDVPEDFPEGQKCMICLCREATCAFLHEATAHKIVCVTCAQGYRKEDSQKTCPLCRKECSHIIRVYGAQ